MNIDSATLYDLGIFTRHEYGSLLNYLDYTHTTGGREWLKFFFERPFSDSAEICERQNLLRLISRRVNTIPDTITNGTVMVMDRYYDVPVTGIPEMANVVNVLFYRILNKQDFSIVRYSVGHFANFVKGMAEIAELFQEDDSSKEMIEIRDRITDILQQNFFESLIKIAQRQKVTAREAIMYGRLLYRHIHKMGIRELEEIFYKFDAWRSMAGSGMKYNFHFPEMSKEVATPVIVARNLYHPLLENPVGYDFSLLENSNFLFLTGANMAGKSTFIRAVGISVYLASLGMAVPADEMRMSCFDGILSNIDISDNTLKGESYFYNEVQRIKATIEKIRDGKRWLILIDELFKGTNIQDAMKCSTSVIEGLRKVSSSLFILSTHLYEIGETLENYPNIQFRYFETEAKNDALLFSYRLKEGISNDRLGYLILKREKVIDMLDKL